MQRSPLERAALRANYAATQTARATWYAAHYALLRRIAGPQGRPGHPPFAAQSAPAPTGSLSKALRELFEKDLANIEAGVYPSPHDMRPRRGVARRLLRRSRALFADAPRTARRKFDHRHSEVFSEERESQYPRYYLQNFHYQSDGWFSRDSARLYDTQVETLFSGAADAMRRQALVPIHEHLKSIDQRGAQLLDLACGTGRLLSFIAQAYPWMPLTALDLSTAYLDEAKRLLGARRRLDFVHANAEDTKLPDAHFDVVVSVFLFHELPPKARRAVAREIARVLKPGGMFVLVDSIQMGDRPDFDILVEHFPVEFHEPFYASYAKEDLNALFGDEGLTPRSLDMAFLSRVASFVKT
ncbi:MAG: class I SAM-dependent methyltransferase [Pseudomonadota bacterium]